MSGTIWTKFYWSDWETDPALRLCSFEAQGLWMRMLCIAAAHDPIGYVAVAGRALDETALARLTGCQESEAKALVGELERNGVFSRDRQGRIYSRRMVTDARKAAIAKKNGKKGGNPSLSNDWGNSASDKGGDKPHKPSANSPKEKAKAFSERASAQKPARSAWVSPKTMKQAAASLIEDIENGFGRPEGCNEITVEAVRLLPAVRAS